MSPASLLGVCVTSALESALLVVVVAAYLFFCRRADATTRHRVWFLTLLGAIALPAISFAALRIPETTAPAAATTAGTALAPLAHVVLPPWLIDLAIASWAAVSAFCLLRLAWSYARLEVMRRRTLPVDAELEASVQGWARRMGIVRHVSVRTSAHLASPIAIGLYRPIIVIPERILTTLVAADIEYVVVHELAHLRRRDDLTNLLAKIARALLAFNPALFVIDRRMAVEREIACDDWVVATLGRARRYARCLAQVLLLAPPHSKAHGYLPFFRTPEQSVARIEMLLDPRDRVFSLPTERANAPLVAAAAIIALGLTFAAGAPPIVAFDSPFALLQNFRNSVHLDALEQQLDGISGIAFARPATPVRSSPMFAQRLQRPHLAYTFTPFRARPAAINADVRQPDTTPAKIDDATTETTQSVDAEPARAAAFDGDAAAAAEVAQRVTFSTGHAPSVHFGVGTPIFPPRTPALAFSYNTIVAAPATFGGGGGSATAVGAAAAGTTSGGASSGGVTIPGGTVAAPPVTVSGRGELPGVRR